MATDNYGLFASGVDPETSIEMQKLLRQQKIAEAMGAQAATPLQGQMVGRTYVPPSLTQGLAQLAQGFLSGRDLSMVDEGMAGLARKAEEADKTAQQKLIDAYIGKPPVMEQMPAGVAGPPRMLDQGVVPTPESKRAAVIDAITSNSPKVRAAAEMLFKIDEAEQAKKDAAIERRITKEESDKRAAESKAEMIRLAASLRPAPQPPSPTLTEVTDPKNPNQLLRIDARVYKGGSLGDVGVLGVAAQKTGQNQEKPMTPQQKIRFDNQISNDFKSTGQVMQTMAQLSKAISDIKGSKGLDYREGYSGYIPAWLQGKNAMTAENRINTLKGKVTQMGKSMATMSGAIGPMAVQEWKIVADAVNAIDPTAGNLQEQLDNVLAQANGAALRIQDWYDRKYNDNFDKYPQFRTDAIPMYPTGYDNATKSSVDALLEKYK